MATQVTKFTDHRGQTFEVGYLVSFKNQLGMGRTGEILEIIRGDFGTATLKLHVNRSQISVGTDNAQVL